jgi:hypothetical protein
VLISYLIRLAVEKSGEEYLSFPQRALFDKLSIRTMRIETDPFGNFLGQGYEVGCGRDWARLATFISRMVSGMANAFCPRAMRNSSAHLRRRGWSTSVQSTVLFLDQWRWPVSRPTRVLLHGGRQRPNYDDRAIA